jgi:hypothetical protein
MSGHLRKDDAPSSDGPRQHKAVETEPMKLPMHQLADVDTSARASRREAMAPGHRQQPARPEDVPSALPGLLAGQAWSRPGADHSAPAAASLTKKVTTADQMPGRPGRFLISCFRVASQELKCAIARAQPTP